MGSVRLGAGAEWPGRSLDPAPWPRPPGTGGRLRTAPGPGAWPGSRRGVRGLLHSGLLQARRRTGRAGRHARVRPPPSAISVPPPARPPPARPPPHAASRLPRRRVFWVPRRSAEWLGSVSAAWGAPPRTGPQKPPWVPERRACGGRAPPPSRRPEPRPCDGPCQLCTRGGRGGASARRGVLSGMSSVRCNIKERSFYIIMTRGTLCVFSSRRLLAKVGNVKNPTLIIKPKWG